MKNGNGKLVMYLVGVIVTLVLFIGFPTLVTNVISNDKDSRMRDHKIDEKVQELREDTNEHLTSIRGDMSEQKVIMAEMLTTLRFIKDNGNGNVN